MAVRVDIEAGEPIILPDAENDESGSYVAFGDSKAYLAPGTGARNFTANEVCTLFLKTATEIGINVLAAYLYDLLKHRKAKALWIDRVQIKDEDLIKETLKAKLGNPDGR